MIDQQDVVRLLLDCPCNAQPVLRSEDERPEDQQIQRALEQGDAFIVRLC